jgi:non-specific serine/threonine protein kinase/serine/threonine-protein kinase
MSETPLPEETIFAQALEYRTGAERAAYLDRACAGNPRLRSAVVSLFRADARAGDLLDLPEWTSECSGLQGVERPGTVIDEYVLLEEIGQGGMGVVWMAEQRHPVRRKVALKIIKPGMDSRRIIAQFEAERQALAMMDHPNIARVFDAGTTECGRPYFIMELVQGSAITEYCDGRALTPQQRLDVFLTVCQAVQHAHQKGVIHLDIKPSNVLVADCDGQPAPRIIDFGVARATGSDPVGWTTFTQHRQLVGTLPYMSPEQAWFNPQDIDTRSDIYSLGVLLYELLTGTTPLEHDQIKGLMLDDVLWMLRAEEPLPPSTRLAADRSLPLLAARRGIDADRLIRFVRGDLDWIVMRCLAKERSERYETADALARDLQRFQRHEPVEATPPSTAYRFKKFLRRHRAAVSAASLLALLLVGGIVGTSVGLLKARSAWRSEARLARKEQFAREIAERRLAQIDKGIAILGSIFEDLDPKAEEIESRPLRAILGDRLDRATSELDGTAIGDPLVVARLQDRLGRTYVGLGHAAPAESLFARARATRETSLGAEHPLTLATMHNQALAIDLAGRSDEAIALLEWVRSVQTNRLGAEDAETLSIEHDLALMYLRRGTPEIAIALLERIRDVRVATLGEEHDLTLDALESLANAYVGAGRANKVLNILQAVKDIRTRKLGPDHVAVLRTLESLAFAYQSVGQMRRSVALFERARDEVVPRLGADHRRSLNVLDNLAKMYRAFGRTADAITLGEQVRDARMKNFGAYHPLTIHTLDNLGQAYQAAGKLDQALTLFQQAATGLEKLEFSHAEASLIIGHLCGCLERMGRLDESMTWREKWLTAERGKVGPKSAAYAKELVKVGDYLNLGKRFEDAESVLREALAILQTARPGDWETAFARTLLGQALVAQRRFAEAEPLLIQGHEDLKARQSQIPWLLSGHLVSGSAESVAELYDAWGQPSKAAAWRSKLDPQSEAHPVPNHAMSKR